jgi:FkbM family methyltransferase
LEPRQAHTNNFDVTELFKQSPQKMTEAHHKDSSPEKSAKSLRQRIDRWLDPLKFAWMRGASMADTLRLFYYAGVKKSLVYRGWTSYSRQRILSFGLKAAGNACFQIHARDNGQDADTIAEIFSPHYEVISSGLPAFQPKVIYDLGANIGIASLSFATLYPDAKFYGFEPLPENHEVCILNYQNLRKSEAFPWAVGSRSEVTVFEANEDSRGGHLQATPANLHLDKHRKQIPVQMYSLADLVRIRKLEPPDFLKIDVEGAELEVLLGMGDGLQSVKRILVETHGATLKAECLAWLREHGFQIYPSTDPTWLWGDRS